MDIVKFEELRSLAFGGIGAAYAAVGDAFENPIRLIHINNMTDQGLLISFDGATDHAFLPPRGFAVYDYAANKDNGQTFFEQKTGAGVWVKREGAVSPAFGTVYVTAMYAARK